MDLLTAFDEQLRRLKDANIDAAGDAQDLNPPAVQLRAPTLTTRFGKGYDAAWQAVAIVPDNGIHNAVAAFGPFIQQIQDALGVIITEMRPDLLLMPDGAQLPSYVLSFTTRIP